MRSFSQTVKPTWIFPLTWNLVDSCASMRKTGTISCKYSRILGHSIQKSIKDDCALRVANMAKKVESHLEARNPKEAWRSIKDYLTSLFLPSDEIHRYQKKCHHTCANFSVCMCWFSFFLFVLSANALLLKVVFCCRCNG